MAKEEVKVPYHQFILNNHDGVVIRCCIHCGLSHMLGQDQQTYEPVWNFIPEEKGDVTFSEPCPAEYESDALFPYHQFILSHHQARVIRFCVRCGLSHSWTQDVRNIRPGRFWRLVRENVRDVTVSWSCPAGLESDAYKQRQVNR